MKEEEAKNVIRVGYSINKSLVSFHLSLYFSLFLLYVSILEQFILHMIRTHTHVHDE